ncbi:MAG: hypothetical protein NT069_33800 [Planctomycetota bacterium]|nr:hypothetical protein [Planctomycetota bacterium]
MMWIGGKQWRVGLFVTVVWALLIGDVSSAAAGDAVAEFTSVAARSSVSFLRGHSGGSAGASPSRNAGALTCFVAEGEGESSVQSQFADWAQRAEGKRRSVIGGTDGWLFLTSDVRFASLGEFWGASAAGVSRSRKPEQADPLAAILDFQRQLNSLDIELWVAPVPPKPAVAGARLLGALAGESPRCDGAVADFLRLLAKENVHVVDLEPAFHKAQTADTGSMYCRTDSHWSGTAIVLAAETIAADLRKRPWFDPGAAGTTVATKLARFEKRQRPVKFAGDLLKLDVEPTPGFMATDVPPSEEIAAWFVTDRATGQPIEPTADSRVLLLGDSHTLFLHEATLHATGAGLSDHLALALNEPVDLIGVRGSGSTSARVTLARQKERLKGKRAVIWCFAAREFTESADGWRKIPIFKP